jgi:carbonic anhydrase
MKTITEAIDRLKAGNKNYVKDGLELKNQDAKRREAVVDKQDPFAIVLSCSDSRVVPEFIFDAGIGELFVIRVAGNIANVSTIATIEYAVVHANIKVIVVMGHQNCGAITVAAKGGVHNHNINHLLEHIYPSFEDTDDDASINQIARQNAIRTVQHLIGNSSIIKDSLEAGKLKVLPAYYRLDTGEVDFL